MSQECLRARAQRETLVGNLKSTVTRPIGVGLSLGCGRLSLTDQERVCYNLHTVHGQMRWVVGSCNRIWGVGFLSISCPLTPGIRLYGVEVVEAGDSTDSRKRQEIKGLPLTRWKQAGDVVQLVRTLPWHPIQVISSSTSVSYADSASVALSPSRSCETTLTSPSQP